MSLADIPSALDALRLGRPVIVADDEGRENEGDVIISAQLATQEWIAWTVRYSSGFICAPMTNEIADQLDLPVMVLNNEDPLGTNYTVSVDAADRLSTGISAADRAHTLRVLADPASAPASLHRPGHILPLRARDGGVRERSGHTEAGVDLMKLAGLVPVAAIAEIVAEDGEMMRLPGLLELGEREGLHVITIKDLISYLDEFHPNAALPTIAPLIEAPRVDFEVETTIPTRHGLFRVRAYRDRSTGADHVAFVAGNPANGAIVRVHSECLTGEAFGSLKCECGPQLDASLDIIQEEGGVVVYLRGQEGRGIGLINKLRAYELQEDGLDTLDANVALGLPVDSREYGAATSILHELGLSSVRLLTNNPEKVRQLELHGVAVTERVPLVVGIGEYNEEYLATKRDRMGHHITDTEIMNGIA
ncbi:GTP cyclohydrolase II [Cryobacterium sp. TMS1-20-1]|uniref:GTP cyclohydrolase II n=1 Tax=unclassified Cryobacterium TaxID=2649013 RepID=UPI001069DEA7|nr:MULTISPECIES: GTP cyclohydrolase II [unclassified Cryobacterium]TFC73485.1 GTP cyclohydrolase II [Cryobacterium sp. TMS1-20-1]TFD51191.1 GTP cyclohydrolase II [Cryobacterium sp. Hh7]